MKKIIIVTLLSIFLMFTACDADTGNVYSHLQEQNLIVDNNNDSEQAIVEGGVYDHLQYNLNEKELERLCLGNYSETEEMYHDLENYAIQQQNSSLCEQLPNTALVFTCEGIQTIYYSKERCLDYFMRE